MAVAEGAGTQEVEAMKHRMEESWAQAAPAYAQWVIENHTTLGLYPRFEAFLAPRLQGRPARILDVASASGEPAATLAAALPQAHVVSTDLAPPFLELGRARTAKAGLANISFETADAEDLHRYADASFDAVTCSLGLMFMPRHQVAVAEFARVLKPGGLFAATVWMGLERVPFFAVVRELASEYDPGSIGVAPAGIAHRFADPAALVETMQVAGLADMACEELEVEFRLAAHVWWRALLEMPLAIKPAVAAAQAVRLEDDVFEEARLRLQAMLGERGMLAGDGSLHIKHNWAWLITARRAA